MRNRGVRTKGLDDLLTVLALERDKREGGVYVIVGRVWRKTSRRSDGLIGLFGRLVL
jgi:hypothetical protein